MDSITAHTREPAHRASQTARILDHAQLYGTPAEFPPSAPGATHTFLRSRFRIEKRPGFLCLTGTGGAPIRKNASSIVRWLKRKGFDVSANRVLARDPKGIWDELVVANGCCIGFRFIREASLEAAIAKAVSICSINHSIN
jgi:hypothetical protein